MRRWLGGNGKMLLITGSFRIPSAAMERALPIMARMIAASRGEDGCLHYGYACDVIDPELIAVTELWRDQAALDRHFDTVHLAEWRADWATLGIADRNLVAYEVGAPRAT